MEIQKLINEIEKVFPKFFDNFENWEYANGSNAGKDFKKIYNRAMRIKRAFEKQHICKLHKKNECKYRNNGKCISSDKCHFKTKKS